MSWRNGNKYGAKRTYSALIDRTFDSKAEKKRAEELWLLQKTGEITDLEFQVKFVLCKKPSIKITIDFKYKEHDKIIYEDSKSGILTRDTRTKLAWIKEKFNVDVLLTT